MGKMLLLAGLALCAVGTALWLFPGRLRWLGRLPGDVRIGDSFSFPIVTCLVLSLVLTVLVNVLLRLLR
ncbi:MAG TPA: DUF2905 family protein [Myxococcales bacterium]|nr:DUF2905 family protein [Myxococcales bacterium]